ncbi:hypothetical protein RISK_004408 [Rhodopirellula islandica]|uniref:Uncharacterized protein n=1 Tax=Rhodopirellula islandica TaxID=595434 RepID=A0A0J1BAJ4_RHOIS|nr:hypothetical protein RISK_004408 [Rhodopirellula islandica]
MKDRQPTKSTARWRQNGSPDDEAVTQHQAQRFSACQPDS